MATVPDLEINADLLNLVKQIPDEHEAIEVWREVTEWATEFYRQTGESATIEDFYRELSGMLRDEEYEVDVV